MNPGVPSPALARVLKGNLCSGCGACAALAPEAIAMSVSGDGFLRPLQSTAISSDADATIARVCPGLGYRQDAGTRPDHPLWGPVISMYQGNASDPELQHQASSGGALSGILLHLLQTGRVDRVVQVTGAPDLPIGNAVVLSGDRADVLAAAGSRYAPSAPLADLPALLDTALRYAFVGKPCDVAALHAMGRFDPRVKERFTYLLSFFCAGVPSLRGAREILARLGVAETDLAAFRYRGHGWPGFATATRHDGSAERMSYAESWGEILSRHVQFRCKICPDGTGGFADVVCADAWETDDRGYPVFDERDGVSLIVCRTEKGEALVRDAAAAGTIEITGYDGVGLAAMQPGQTNKRRLTLARLLALRILNRPMPRYRGFHLIRNAVHAGVWRNLRNFLGTLRRAFRNRE